jgi:hypothetical protein
VVEFGTMRALGEVCALESLGIDPIHYLVMPRMLGLSLAVFCLTTYVVFSRRFSAVGVRVPGTSCSRPRPTSHSSEMPYRQTSRSSVSRRWPSAP